MAAEHEAVHPISEMSAAPAQATTPRLPGPPAGDTTTPTVSHPWLSLVAVALGLTMVLLDTSIVSVANPRIGDELHASVSGLQWVTSAFLVAIATGMVLGGKLGDRYGRKTLFICGARGFALASLGCGLSGSLGTLICFRAAQGLAGAAMMPQTLATLRASFPAESFALVVGVYVGISSLAIASGPIVGGVLVANLGWRSIFFINLVIAAAAVTMAARYITASKNPHAAGIDPLGAGLLAAAVFCVVWALVNTDTHPWVSSYTLGFLAAATILFGLWTLRMARAHAPMVPLSLFASARFATGIALIITVGFAFLGTLFYLTLYLQRVHGYGPAQAGLHLLPLTIAAGLAAPVGGSLAHRLSLRITLASAMVLIAAGAAGLTGYGPTTPFTGLWPSELLLGIGVGLVLTGGSQAVVGGAPPQHAGIATGIQQTSLNLGGALGTALLGSLAVSHAASRLPGALARHHLPTHIAAAIAADPNAVAQGILPPRLRLPPALARAVQQALDLAATSGIHLDFLVVTVLALGGGAAALAFLRPARPAAQSPEERRPDRPSSARDLD